MAKKTRLRKAESLRPVVCQVYNRLKKGAKGKPVNQLQTALNKNGVSPKLKVDGVFGPKTDAGVRAFQKKKKLKVDGIAGEMSLFALKIGPRPKSLDLPDSEIFHSVGYMESAAKNNGPKIAAVNKSFIDASKETDNLRQVLLARSKTMTERWGKVAKSYEKLAAPWRKELNDLKKRFAASTDPAEIKKLRDSFLDVDAKYSKLMGKEGTSKETEKLNQTMKDIRAYQKAVKSLQSHLEKIQ